ncbi:hypothetical protein [Methylomonas methanica]|uniref:Uncharacterized protein n=1 Tax=Methylomonas methanica TaxID=421 RepID=A0A177LUV6_METMH|nr:hypothetical protein [Methylomonas methanica]OAH97053.1 hypothetical protein A1332_22145 [Methylomonas methanica]
MARGKDLAAIAKAYDASGIVDRPPPETLTKLSHANYVVCSELPRSVETALPNFDSGKYSCNSRQTSRMR